MFTPEITAGIIMTVITLPTGIAFIVLGLLLWKKQKIGLLHDYHRRNVRPRDVAAYTRLWGVALIVLGACTCPIGPIELAFKTALGWLLFAAGMAACFIIGNKAQKTYNGSWFS